MRKINIATCLYFLIGGIIVLITGIFFYSYGIFEPSLRRYWGDGSIYIIFGIILIVIFGAPLVINRFNKKKLEKIAL